MRKNLEELLMEACKAIKIFFGKANSRKFLVWVVATHMAYTTLLDSNAWLTISLIYMGGLTALDWKAVNAIQANPTDGSGQPESDMGRMEQIPPFPIKPLQ